MKYDTTSVLQPRIRERIPAVSFLGPIKWGCLASVSKISCPEYLGFQDMCKELEILPAFATAVSALLLEGLYSGLTIVTSIQLHRRSPQTPPSPTTYPV
jgi:hypothetical protein